MFITVRYWKNEKAQFSGREYTYHTTLDDLQPGDVVYAPTMRTDAKAVVVTTNIPGDSIPVHIRSVVRDVVRRYDPPSPVDDYTGTCDGV